MKERTARITYPSVSTAMAACETTAAGRAAALVASDEASHHDDDAEGGGNQGSDACGAREQIARKTEDDERDAEADSRGSHARIIGVTDRSNKSPRRATHQKNSCNTWYARRPPRRCQQIDFRWRNAQGSSVTKYFMTDPATSTAP